jgi:hypothetical protein
MKTSAEDEEILPVILISHKSKFFLWTEELEDYTVEINFLGAKCC